MNKTNLYVAVFSEIFYRWDCDEQDYRTFRVDCFCEYCRHYDWRSVWDYLIEKTEDFNKSQRYNPRKKDLGFFERHILDVYKLR